MRTKGYGLEDEQAAMALSAMAACIFLSVKLCVNQSINL